MARFNGLAVVLVGVAALVMGCVPSPPASDGATLKMAPPPAAVQSESEGPAEALVQSESEAPAEALAVPTPAATPALKQPSEPLSAEASRSATEVPVVRVVDGDTIRVIFEGKEEPVRLIGVDTPETVHPTRGVEPYGKEASEYTKSRLQGQRVHLEFDVEQRDRYGRLLAYVWIGDELFNATLLAEGYAQVATFPPNVKYVERFTVIQKEARKEGRGLWGAEAPAVAEAPVVAPAAPAAPASTGGVTITSITSPVARNSTATVQAVAAPGASCSITVPYKSGPSKAAGLAPKSAAADGRISWSWTVGTNTTQGTWPVSITCDSGRAETTITVR